MKHHHFDIIQAYYSDPDKWDIYFYSKIYHEWIRFAESAAPIWMSWEENIAYKLVSKEKKKTKPCRRFIYTIGAVDYYVGHVVGKKGSAEKMSCFVRWLDDDWIEYDVDVDGKNEIVSMARGD